MQQQEQESAGLSDGTKTGGTCTRDIAGFVIFEHGFRSSNFLQSIDRTAAGEGKPCVSKQSQ